MKKHPILSHLEDVAPYRDVVTDSDLLSIPPPPMLIEDVLPRAGVMGITSYPGVGKSWLALELCRSVTTGKKFLGNFDATAGSALFIGSDSSLYDYARQWQRLGRLQRAEFAEATKDMTPAEMVDLYGPDANFGIFNSMRFLVQSSFMLDDFEQVKRLLKTHLLFEHGPYEEQYEKDRDLVTGEQHEEFLGIERGKGYDLIVFDTLSRLSRANQNDNTEMENVFRNIRMIAEATGAAIVLLHHNSKPSEYNDGSDWRGAMSQIGALDSWIQLTPTKGKNKARINVQYKKFRGITPANFAYLMEVSNPETATLTHLDGDAAVDATDADGLCLSILGWLRGSSASKDGNTVLDIATALHPEFADLFVNEAGPKKFKQAVKNRLYDEEYGLVTTGGPVEKIKVPGVGKHVIFRAYPVKEKA